ncbi:non-ribosomal peptide synthetase [Roseateles sp.]|uniref:non-ribosomal peptide synthetase n=1 Tax=Roseateles sp. TaxID=1971397 RepID=UPI003D1128C1
MKFPMTIAQQGIWFLSQTDRSVSTAYNVVIACNVVSGRLDAIALSTRLDAVARRHPLLRARVVVEDGTPSFEVDEDAPATEVLSTCKGALPDIALRERAVPLDDTQGPLFRAVLTSWTSPDGSVRQGLVLTFAHLVFDGPSLQVFLDELGDAAALTRSAAEADPPSAQALADRESAFLQGDAGRHLCVEAVQRLRDLPARVEWPARDPAPSLVGTGLAGELELELPVSLVEAVRVVCAERRVNPAAVYLAVTQLLVWRNTGQTDFGISLPVSNRDAPGTDRAIGYLTNLGILRARIDARKSLSSLLASTSEGLFDLLDERQLPFPVLVRALKRSRQDLQGPLMQIAFNYQRLARQDMRCGEAVLRVSHVPVLHAKNQLKIEVDDSGESVVVRLAHERAALDGDLAASMLRQFQTLLASAVSDPEGAVGGLKVLSELEREHVLAVGKGPGELAQDERGVHELFEAQAASTPEAVAVVCGGRTLSYRELDEWSSRVAWRLHQAYGVRAESRVAIAMERSLEMVVALLGVLKAGAAYVPMDPEHPGPRLSAQLRDAGVRVVLTQQHLRERLPVHEGVTLALDDGEPGWTQGPVNRVGEQGSPQQLAYCIYTSGSTGQPKAVMVSRGNLSRYVAAAAQRLGIEPGMIYLYASPFFADLGNTTLFLALSAGGTLCLLEPQAQLDAERVAELMARWRVDCLKITPSHLAALMSGRDAAGFLPRRRLVFGGEPLTAELVARCRREGLSIHNHYGPTEATIGAVAGEVTGDEVTRQRMALGRAMAGMRVYVLDAALEPVPAGVAGELYIGGGGVARGYLNRPGQTAERFIADPYGAPGARMYRTGDLARMDERGVVEYMGRIDQQLKIRGFRVEPAEVEQAVLETGLASEVAVLGSGPDETDLRLVGYVVAAAGAAPSAQALTLAAQARLPAHMVPAAWVLLPALPLNANGKLDRAALPVPELSRPASGIEYVEPRTPTEAALAAIWAEVLRIERVGVHDNFFALGGHSLLVVQMIGRVNARLGRQWTMKDLFAAPTLEALAELLDRTAAESPAAVAPPTIQRRARNGASPMSISEGIN